MKTVEHTPNPTGRCNVHAKTNPRQTVQIEGGLGKTTPRLRPGFQNKNLLSFQRMDNRIAGGENQVPTNNPHGGSRPRNGNVRLNRRLTNDRGVEYRYVRQVKNKDAPTRYAHEYKDDNTRATQLKYRNQLARVAALSQEGDQHDATAARFIEEIADRPQARCEQSGTAEASLRSGKNTRLPELNGANDIIP